MQKWHEVGAAESKWVIARKWPRSFPLVIPTPGQICHHQLHHHHHRQRQKEFDLLPVNGILAKNILFRNSPQQISNIHGVASQCNDKQDRLKSFNYTPIKCQLQGTKSEEKNHESVFFSVLCFETRTRIFSLLCLSFSSHFFPLKRVLNQEKKPFSFFLHTFYLISKTLLPIVVPPISRLVIKRVKPPSPSSKRHTN